MGEDWLEAGKDLGESKGLSPTRGHGLGWGPYGGGLARGSVFVCVRMCVCLWCVVCAAFVTCCARRPPPCTHPWGCPRDGACAASVFLRVFFSKRSSDGVPPPIHDPMHLKQIYEIHLACKNDKSLGFLRTAVQGGCLPARIPGAAPGMAHVLSSQMSLLHNSSGGLSNTFCFTQLHLNPQLL